MHQTITRGPARPEVPSTGNSGRTAADSPAPRDAASGRPRYAESARSMAGVALLLGAAGLFIFNIVLGPLAIGIGAATLRRRPSPRTRAIALAGLAFGAADLVVLAVLVAVSLAHGGIDWHFAA
jgi:hypothetical protein